jgi:hypothetical protein
MAVTINASTSAGLVQTADTSGVLQLQTNSGTTALTIDTSQNVGIGTTSPSQRLDVQATTGANILKLSATTTTNECYQTFNNAAGAFYVGLDNSTGATFGSAYSANFYQSGAYPMIFWTNNAERMRITSGGTVRINTTSSIGSSTERLGILQTTTDADIITVRNSGATAGRYWSSPYVDTSSTYYIINNDSTGVKLTHGSTSWAAQSDARLKNITGTYTNALSDIAQIQPVKFTWKDDLTNKAQVGVIAQSVLPVVPEAVEALTIPKSEDGTEYLSVRYTELIPLIIASIQEQQTIINDLKARITALEGAA